MKRNPFAVQSVDSGWVHGAISHAGRRTPHTPNTLGPAAAPSAGTRGRERNIRPEPVGNFQPADGPLPRSDPRTDTPGQQPEPGVAPVDRPPHNSGTGGRIPPGPSAPNSGNNDPERVESRRAQPPNNGASGQPVARGRSASRSSNASNIRGSSAASSTGSKKSRSRATEGLGDTEYGEYVKQILKLTKNTNISHDDLVIQITKIIRNCAVYTAQQLDDQYEQEIDEATFEHHMEIDKLNKLHATTLDDYTRALDERDNTIKILDKNMGEIMSSTEKMKGTNSQLHHKLNEVTLERDERDKKIENLQNQMQALINSSEDMIRDNSELANQLQEANDKIKELEDQIDDLLQQIAQSQQNHADLMADVFRKTEDPKHVSDDIRAIKESRDGPAEDNTTRFLGLEDHRIKRELPGSPASREHLLRRVSTLPPRNGDGHSPRDDISTRAAGGPAGGTRPALRRASTLQPGGRGGQNREPPRWQR